MSKQKQKENVILLNQSRTRGIIAQEISNALNTLIASNGLDPSNIIYIVTNLMSITGRYDALTNREKKEIVIILVNKAIDDSEIDDQVKVTLKLMMETIIPNAIDILVDVANGRYKFKYLPTIITFFKKCNWCKKK